MKTLVISDIHANHEALRATLAQSPDEEVWFLGDLVGYGPEVEAVATWFYQTPPNKWLPGNHDLALWFHRFENRLNELAQFTLDAHRRWLKQQSLFAKLLVAMDSFNPNQREKAKLTNEADGLPQVRTQDTIWILSHGALWLPEHRFTLYLYPWAKEVCPHLSILEKLRQRERVARVVLLLGHTHLAMYVGYRNGHYEMRDIPFQEEIALPEGVWILNPGALGLPRDGDVRAASLRIDLDRNTVRFQRVPYSYRRVLQKAWNRYPDWVAEKYERAFWASTHDRAPIDEILEQYQQYYRWTKDGLERGEKAKDFCSG